MYQQANAQWQQAMNSPVVPYPVLQPTSGQQVSTNQVIAPMQHHIQQIHNYSSEDYTSKQSQRMTSTSEEEEETQKNSKNKWQVIRRTKRKKIQRTQHPRNKNRKHITDMVC